MSRHLIIDRPDLQTWRQRAVFGVLTATFWVAWFFLWLPAITMLGWLAFGYQFRLHMIDLEGYKGFLGLLAIYALIIAAMGGSLILWAKYNHVRFRGVDRRRDAPTPTLADSARWVGQPEIALAKWRTFDVMTVHHDEHGRIVRVEAAPQPTAAPADTAC